MNHVRIDQRSLVMHRAIAGKLRTDPTLLHIAHDNLNRWMSTANNSRPYFEKWREILARPVPEILDIIVEDTETMSALRQCSPFAGLLTAKERWAIYEQFSPTQPVQP
jgi:hypothetical protein